MGASAFDHFGIPFDLIYKERVRKGSLRRDYDVILVPNQGRAARAWSTTWAAREASPWPTRRPTEFQNLGMYGESEDITGGMGLEGVVELEPLRGGRRRAHDPGRSTSVFPGRLRAHARVERRRPSGQFYAPRTHRGGGDPAPRASHLLRLHPEDAPRPVHQRSAPADPGDGKGRAS